MIIYPILPMLHGDPIAIGATLGQQHIRGLLQKLQLASTYKAVGEIIIFDFSDVEAVNGSYVQTTALWLTESAQLANKAEGEGTVFPSVNEKFQAIPLNVYPFVAGLNAEVAKDINLVFTYYALPCLEALTWNEEAVLTARIYGKLESTLRHTMEIVTEEDIVTAASLHTTHPGENINITGWNNRLADLYSLRLLRRTRQGKQWLYSSLVKERIIG